MKHVEVLGLAMALAGLAACNNLTAPAQDEPREAVTDVRTAGADRPGREPRIESSSAPGDVINGPVISDPGDGTGVERSNTMDPLGVGADPDPMLGIRPSAVAADPQVEAATTRHRAAVEATTATDPRRRRGCLRSHRATERHLDR
jgi:hypothetical protein